MSKMPPPRRPPPPRGSAQNSHRQGQQPTPTFTNAAVSGNLQTPTPSPTLNTVPNPEETELRSEVQDETEDRDDSSSSEEPETQEDRKEATTQSSRGKGLYSIGNSLKNQVSKAKLGGKKQTRDQEVTKADNVKKDEKEKQREEERKEAAIDPTVAVPTLSVANEVDKAKVDISVGAVNVEAGDRTTILKEGGEMEIANKANEAEVKIELDDVTMKLGDDVTVHSAGGGLRLDALGTTTVEVKAGAQTIKMEDKAKLTVHGMDVAGEVTSASIQKGAVDIEMGAEAEIVIKGPLPNDLHEVKDDDEEDDTLTIRAKDRQRLVLEAGEEANDEEERTLGHEIITRGRQAYKILHEERLIYWKGLSRCQNRHCESKRLRMELGPDITIIDTTGRHDLQACVCLCLACKKEMLPREETYLKQGLWPVERGRYLIDVQLFRFYESLRDCCKELSPQTFVAALGHLSEKYGRSRELNETIFLNAFFEWKKTQQ